MSEEGKYEVPGGFPEAFLKSLEQMEGSHYEPDFIYVGDHDYAEMELRGIDMSKIRRMSFFGMDKDTINRMASQMAKNAFMVHRLKRIK